LRPDFVGVAVLTKFIGLDAKDLIYEGIATSAPPLCTQQLVRHDAKDLIYEGIATICPDLGVLSTPLLQTPKT